MLKHSFYLIIYVLRIESKFLIKHLVRSRETEAFESEHLSVASHESLEVYRKTCSETEDLGSIRKDALLIFLRLCAEKSF